MGSETNRPKTIAATADNRISAAQESEANPGDAPSQALAVTQLS